MREPSLRRSLLFVPGDNAHKLDRADSVGADTLVLDLEDSVATSQKELAREEVTDRLRSGLFKESEVAVRINAPGTPYFQDDLTSVVLAGARLVMVPKVESARSMAAVAEAVALYEPADAPVYLLALIESARGISNAELIGRSTWRLEGFCFGNVDFALDMRITDGDLSYGIVHHARCNLVIAAAATGLSPIDGVCLYLRDSAAFSFEANAAVRLGYQGKCCLHPAQVPLANKIFTPTDEQVATAKEIIEAWDTAAASGKAVASLNGKIIGGPLVEIQRRILERAR